MGAYLGKPVPKSNAPTGTGATSPALPAGYFGEEGAAEGETRFPVATTGTTGGRRRNRKSRRGSRKNRKTRKGRK